MFYNRLRRLFSKTSITPLIIPVTTVLLIFLVGGQQYNRRKAWWNWEEYEDGTSHFEQGNKVIVMAKLENQNTNWVEENLPDWQRAIYTVDNIDALLHTPANKGKESMAYLTYIIEHYANLPQTILFLHSHQSGWEHGWHTDTWGYDNVRSVKSLQLSYVQTMGYVNLRCSWNPGCKPAHRKNAHVTLEIWEELFGNSTYAPELIGAACCAQFAVSRDQVLARSLDEYINFRQWIIDTTLNDEKSGRVLEFLWHVIFGKESVYCPDPKSCYCNVYGRCDGTESEEIS